MRSSMQAAVPKPVGLTQPFAAHQKDLGDSDSRSFS